MGKILSLKLALLLLIPWGLEAQNKYWISAPTESQQRLLDSLQLSPERCSEWLDQCAYLLHTEELNLIQFSGVACTLVNTFSLATRQPFEPTFALEQIGSEAFIKKGLTGKGVKIGIIDGGFLKANEAPSLAHFFNSDLVAAYKDYITPDLVPYTGIARLDDTHGAEVWQMIGGIDPANKIQFGLATQSTYYLARTDHGAYEKRIEEDYLIEALEDLTAQGVKLINISLGYNIGFADASENYRPEQMDGKTALLTQAVEYASVEKGVLVVVAAGNDGSDRWRIISTPSDAEHALVVGATKFDIWDKMDYSSIGADFVSYVKPDVAVFSSLGTSFSAPIITGLAACMMEYDSSLTNIELMDIIRKSSNFYPYPNNYLGFGVPSCDKIIELMNGQKIEPSVELLETTNNTIRISGPFADHLVVAYHKNGDFVKFRNHWKPRKNNLKISRPEGVNQTSVLYGKKVYEILWK